jgi:hypothetical protein
MNQVKAIGRLSMLAVGLGLGATVAATPGVASADDMQISIDGMDLFPIAGNTATATSDSGDIAIAVGNGADANATGGFGDFAYVDGAGSTAEAGFNGDFDSAVVVGANSTAEAGFGVCGVLCAFPLPGGILPTPNYEFDTAAAFGNSLNADATSGSFVTDIVPSSAAAAAAPTVIPDLDPFEDLHGGGPGDWTGAIDSLLDKYDPSLAAGLDAGADNFLSADANPFSDLVSSIDPNAFIGGVPNPNDLLGVVAVTLDYGVITYDLPALLGPGVDPLVTGFQDYMVGLDSVVGSLLGSI